jgi:hypothetical protein
MVPLLKFSKVQFCFGLIEILPVGLSEFGIDRLLSLTYQGLIIG